MHVYYSQQEALLQSMGVFRGGPRGPPPQSPKFLLYLSCLIWERIHQNCSAIAPKAFVWGHRRNAAVLSARLRFSTNTALYKSTYFRVAKILRLSATSVTSLIQLSGELGSCNRTQPQKHGIADAVLERWCLHDVVTARLLQVAANADVDPFYHDGGSTRGASLAAMPPRALSYARRRAQRIR